MKNIQLLVVILLSSYGLFAQSSEIFSTEEGALRGYDPVAYFKTGDAIKGKKEFSLKQNKKTTWYFSSAENLAAFKSSPEKFTPQYGGYCAYGASDGDGHKAPTQPDAWKIIDGKLYFNYNKNIQSMWLKDTTNLIRRADANWPKIKNQ
jgi:YHS domain-containing protein